MEKPAFVSQLKTDAKMALSRHDFEGARETLTMAIAIEPFSHKLYRLRSVAYACLRDYENSLRDAEKVIELHGECTDGYYHKARAFQDGLRLNPSDRVLRQASANVSHACMIPFLFFVS